MAMEPNATRFPFPLPLRTIGEQKAKVNRFSFPVMGQFPVAVFIKHVALCCQKTMVWTAIQSCAPKLRFNCKIEHSLLNGKDSDAHRSGRVVESQVMHLRFRKGPSHWR
jgi:hypothetical protein